jgi:hypothetical protein
LGQYSLKGKGDSYEGNYYSPKCCSNQKHTLDIIKIRGIIRKQTFNPQLHSFIPLNACKMRAIMRTTPTAFPTNPITLPMNSKIALTTSNFLGAYYNH